MRTGNNQLDLNSLSDDQWRRLAAIFVSAVEDQRRGPSARLDSDNEGIIAPIPQASIIADYRRSMKKPKPGPKKGSKRKKGNDQ